MLPEATRRLTTVFALAALWAGMATGLPLRSAQKAAPPALELTAEQIIQRLMEANERRDQLLAGWEVRRTYRLQNEIYEKNVVRVMEVTFRAPDQLVFEELRTEGSGFLANRVFGPMVEGEKESLEPGTRRRSAMTPQNYQFTLAGREELEKRPAYVLAITPRREDKFLLEGKIWVDAEDFAVVRAEGTPAEMPSFWTRDIELTRTFKKVGPFWLPDETKSTTEVFLFGTTRVWINNGDYKVQLKPAPAGGPS